MKLFTPKFRVSFPQIFEAKAMEGSDKKFFTMAMIFDTENFDKEDQEKWDAMVASINTVAKEKFSELPAKLKKPFVDGNTQVNAKSGEIYQGYENRVIVRAKSQEKPGVVDENVNPIIEPNQFYGGCYAIATINPYAWSYLGKYGVSFGIQNIQKVADGESFSGKTKAEDDFSAISAPSGSSNSELFG